jgi:urease subunit alpha
MPGPEFELDPERLTPEEYLKYFGPTKDFEVRLADTDILITVEEDYSRGSLGSGNEVVFGGGKVTRDSMGQGPYNREYHRNRTKYKVPDTVITGALILDHWGVVKADVALRDGKIHAIGKAGNPLIMSDVKAADRGEAFQRLAKEDRVNDCKGVTFTHHPTGDLIIGPETEIIAGNGKILTAGAIDTHVHFLLPGLAEHALSGGITTCIGGGTGMATGSVATTVTPGAWHFEQMFKAMDGFPLNVGLLGKGSVYADGRRAAMNEFKSQAEAGACGFKIHEDWGATPATLRDTLKAANEWDVQVSLHSDTLNEAGFFQRTRKVIEDVGRSIHSFHTEGAGGGHAPDVLRMASMDHVLPASTNPTLPLTKNTTAEAYWMVMLAHHLNPKVANDNAFASSRVRLHTTFAENVLHDFGALSITSSDALAMGRIGELVMRTWQTADFMKGYWPKSKDGVPPDPSDTGGMDMRDDNDRARRYVAKYTINPAIAQGIDKDIGSIQAGKYADLVLWDPRFFGLRAEMVLQGGVQVWAVCGSPTAAVTQPQPYWGRENWGNGGKAVTSCTRMFVSRHAGRAVQPDRTIKDRHRLKDPETEKPWVAVEPTKELLKSDMRNNGTRPEIQIGGAVKGDDPGKDSSQSYIVTIGDQRYLPPNPLPHEVPMTQRYTLF